MFSSCHHAISLSTTPPSSDTKYHYLLLHGLSCYNMAQNGICVHVPAHLPIYHSLDHSASTLSPPFWRYLITHAHVATQHPLVHVSLTGNLLRSISALHPALPIQTKYSIHIEAYISYSAVIFSLHERSVLPYTFPSPCSNECNAGRIFEIKASVAVLFDALCSFHCPN